MLNDLEGSAGVSAKAGLVPSCTPCHRPAHSKGGVHAHDTIVKSATRALEVIELFAVYRAALSVSAIAEALNIPQSSSSILLKAMNRAGFIERDARTRKYLPSIRSALFGNRMHECFLDHTALLSRVDRLSNQTGCSVRLAVRRGIYVQYAHVSWPDGSGDRLRFRPGATTPVCRDILGMVLLAAENDETVSATVRHANAVADPDVPRIRPGDYISQIRCCRKDGFSEGESFDRSDEHILAIRLPTTSGAAAAIGICVEARRLARERPIFLAGLREAVELSCG